MSLARDAVRERGTWRFGALCAAVVLTIVTCAPATLSAPPHARTPVPTRIVTTKPDHRTKKNDPAPKTISDVIRDVFGKHADDALRVARCESRLDPNAVSGSFVGIFQIGESFHGWRVKEVRGKDLTHARTNVRVARHLFDDQGWRPWTCARIVGVTA